MIFSKFLVKNLHILKKVYIFAEKIINGRSFIPTLKDGVFTPWKR